MNFLADFEKDTKKMEGVSTGAPGPKFWISTGNYILNKIISGKYKGGIGQGKLAMLAGPSSAGKSFVTANIMRAAQQMGCGILVLDSENALDDAFVEAIGVDTTPEDGAYTYRGVTTITQAVKTISSFLKAYRNHNMDRPYLIVVDSLDAMMTESMLKNYSDGDVKGDQGQHAKQLKAMLSPFMHDIKDINVAILCTKQVYKNQDGIAAKNPVNEYLLTEALKYPFSQIALITRLMLRDDVTRDYEGIKLKVFGLKTRFTKPFQQAKIDVPYDTGMDPFAGILEVAEAVGIVTRAGSWYTLGDKKFQRKNFEEYQEDVLTLLIEKESEVINVKMDEEEISVDD